MTPRIVRGPEAAPLEPIEKATVAVLGYGNQGHAHALNLRDSGIRTIVGARPGSSGSERARAAGFETMSLDEAARQGDLVLLAIPDEEQAAVYKEHVEDSLQENVVLGFMHGFAIRFGLVQPPEHVGVVMVAPKGPGTLLRSRYERGLGLPCLLALHQDRPRGDAEAIALAWASGIGCARAGIIYTSFAEESETDMFGEQSVLCGGLVELIVAAFETLVEAGYPPELAYLECGHEVKQIADLIYERGLAGMTRAISNTAEFGAYEAGPRLVDDGVRQRMRAILEDVRSGRFAERIQEDHSTGFRWFNARRSQLAAHPIEAASAVIRGLMDVPSETTNDATRDVEPTRRHPSVP